MNKAVVAGIIVAVVFIIGVISAFSYNSNSVIKTHEKDKVGSETVKAIEQPVTPKKYSVNLTEAIGTTGSP